MYGAPPTPLSQKAYVNPLFFVDAGSIPQNANCSVHPTTQTFMIRDSVKYYKGRKGTQSIL